MFVVELNIEGIPFYDVTSRVPKAMHTNLTVYSANYAEKFVQTLVALQTITFLGLGLMKYLYDLFRACK